MITNERQELISQFVTAINEERDGKKYKKVTGRQIAIKLSHLDLQTLYYLMSVCRDAKNRMGSFSKYFWYLLKVR